MRMHLRTSPEKRFLRVGFILAHPAWPLRRNNLDDLSFVRVGRWEGDLWAGEANGAAGIYIDDRADERQAEILPRIFGGQVGGFPDLGCRVIHRRPANPGCREI